jgi:cation transport regulator ChaB
VPYPTNESLPQAVKDKIKSPKRRRQWRHVWNSEYQSHGDESRAFASAWSVAQKKRKKKRDAQTKKYLTPSPACLSASVFPPWLWLC